MGLVLWLGLVLLAKELLADIADIEVTYKECTPPLKLIYQVVPHFKTTQFCSRICTSDYDVSNDGVRRIRFKCELKKLEIPSELCDCVYNYISQKNWMNGAKRKCCFENNHVTLEVTGQPDPTYQQETDQLPLLQLKAVLDEFPNAELARHKCRPTTSIDDNGCVHCKIECDLRPDSPSKDEICRDIIKYLNQDNWLDPFISTCASEGQLLYLDIIGDSQTRGTCVRCVSKNSR